MREISPLVFGPGTWTIMHIFAIVCDNDKNDREYFFIFLDRVLRKLPCKTCRKHASEYLDSNDPSSASELFRWTWEFHNSVNERLKKPNLPYEDAFKIYENAEIIVEEDCSTCSVDGGIDVLISSKNNN